MKSRVWCRLLAAGLLCLSLVTPARADDDDTVARLEHLLGYLAVDYPDTVSNGRVVNKSEYAEQREFSQRAIELGRKLSDKKEKPAIEKSIVELARQIEKRASGQRVSALARDIRANLLIVYPVKTAPSETPDLARGAALYATQCASCHGASGRGDGPAAKGLDPPPVNFHDRARQSQRSVYDLFNIITLGVEGTAMQGYAALSLEDRWAIAFHVANLPVSDEERRAGERHWREGTGRDQFRHLGQLTGLSPAQVLARHGQPAEHAFTYLRANPAALAQKEPALDFSRRMMAQSLARYQANDARGAYELAVTAYLEGFELVERTLVEIDRPLKDTIEREMNEYRQLVHGTGPLSEAAERVARIDRLLTQAATRLNDEALTPGIAFTSSLVILLREGLEAILLLAVVVAFLVRTEQRHLLRYIHIGWVSALALGVATWAVASYVVDISGANRELTEGVTALIAAAVLLYVGFWLHNKLQAARWKEFLESHVHGALRRGTLWSIAGVAFIAVYREVFETVLFYQALWMQAGPAGRPMIGWGFAAAAALLGVLSWLIFRYSVRLPLRLFFSVNSVLLYTLAVIFAGKGIAALQEAGAVPMTLLALPKIETLGFYPTVQTVALQGLLVVLAIGVVWRDRRRAAKA